MPTNNNLYEQNKREKMLLVILLLSVALNLFFGLWTGFEPGTRSFRHFGPMAMSDHHGDFMEERLTRYLNTADAAAFHEAVQPQIDALKQAHAHMHHATKELAAAYEQDPPDAAALQSALDQVKQAKDEVTDIVAEIIVSSDAKLSPEGRHRLAEMTR